jgi:hypothetical protein
MKLKDLKPNPENPRTVTDEKLLMLKKSLSEFGDLSGVIYNRKTKLLVGGHQRTKLIPKDSIVTVLKQYEKPTKTGTVAEGFIVANGERFSYREVAWDKSKEKAANIAANKGAGEWNIEQLSTWMQELDGELFDLDLTMFDKDERLGFFAVSDFGPGSEDEQGKLDEKTPVTCPNCSHEFVP